MHVNDALVCKACGEVVQASWTLCPGCSSWLLDTGVAIPVAIYLLHFKEDA